MIKANYIQQHAAAARVFALLLTARHDAPEMLLREVARRTGDLQRRKSGLGGLSSSRSFHAVNDFLASG